MSATVASRRASSACTAGRFSGRTSSQQLVEHRAHPAHHLDRCRAVAANLGRGEREVVLPAPDRDQQAGAASPLALPAGPREIDRADHPQHIAEVIHHLHRRGRIVDRRRQRLVGDIDHDPDRERRILLDRALGAERDHPAESCAPLARIERCAAVGLDQRAPGRHEITDRVAKDDELFVRARPLHQPAHVDRLDRPRRRAVHHQGRLLVGDVQDPPEDVGRACEQRLLLLEVAPRVAGTQRRDGHRPQPMQEPVQGRAGTAAGRRAARSLRSRSRCWARSCSPRAAAA